MSKTRPYGDFEEQFYWCTAWYNGESDTFDRLLDYLKSNYSQTADIFEPIYRPDWIKSDGSTDILELYWMILVCQWGEYGTSPRSGWINQRDLGMCIDHLETMRNKTYGEQEYLCE